MCLADWYNRAEKWDPWVPEKSVPFFYFGKLVTTC